MKLPIIYKLFQKKAQTLPDQLNEPSTNMIPKAMMLKQLTDRYPHECSYNKTNKMLAN